MKLILVVLLSLLAICLAAESKFPRYELCNRCQDLARAIKLYRKHYKNADENQFTNWVKNTCERAIHQEEKELCQIDVENISKIWSLAVGNMSPEMACFSSKVCKRNQDLSGIKFDYQQFVDYKNQYNKQYTPSENFHKATTFFTNLKKIERLNKESQDKKLTTRFGVTEHTDLSVYEFKLLILSKHEAVADPNAPIVTKTNVGALPDSFDWRTKGAVTPVKNQGQCGSCWSFSTTGNVEGQWFLAGHTLVGLSEQNLVDCDHECMQYENQQSCDDGCDGGLMPNAFTYIIKNKGIDTEASYPYNAVDGTCSFNKANVGATISNYTMVSKNETLMAEYLVEHGPVSIAADAQEWQFYIGGVFDFPCGKTLDHGILIVGYGTEVDILGFHIPYWWVKNSWGASWGEKGYLKIKRGDCKCGLCEFACSSIV